MQPKHDLFNVQIPIALYCLWNARDLLGAWEHCLYDRYGWLVMLIWCMPLLSLQLARQKSKASSSIQSLYTGAGLLLSFTGSIGSLNLLQYAGLALVLAGWIPFSRVQLFWLLASLSWMPALGWIGSRFFLDHVLMVRVLLAGTASVWISFYTATKQRQPECMAIQN